MTTINTRQIGWKFILCLATVFFATSIALAQGTISDGNKDFSINVSGFDVSPSANFRVAVPTDHLFEQGFWYRIAGDIAETFFPVPDTQDYTGSVATLDWTDVNSRGFAARVVGTIKAGGDASARVQLDMTVTNNSGASLEIDLFHMADIDLQPSAGNDSATLLNPNDYISLTTGGSSNTAEYRGPGASAYLVRAFGASDVGAVLGNASLENLDNSGLPFGAGDFTGGFQWSRTIENGESTTVTVILAVNEPANSLTEACLLPDLSCSVLNQPSCETAGGSYLAELTCVDTDNDGRADVGESCPIDPDKFEPGVCGCGVADTDTDLDGAFDCNESCIFDPAKTVPGICGCGIGDVDLNANGITDCLVTPELQFRLLSAKTLAKKIKIVTSPVKKKIRAQRRLRAMTRELMSEIVSFVGTNGGVINLSNSSSDLDKLTKLANRKVRRAARGIAKTFKKDKKGAQKALAKLIAALAV